MAKWLLVVETNAKDAAHEAEFNEWYDNIHLPDVLETPGILRATRYERIGSLEGKAKFLATYEIETQDIDQTMKAVRENLAKKRAEGRFSNFLVSVSSALYKEIGHLSR